MQNVAATCNLKFSHICLQLTFFFAQHQQLVSCGQERFVHLGKQKLQGIFLSEKINTS